MENKEDLQQQMEAMDASTADIKPFDFEEYQQEKATVASQQVAEEEEEQVSRRDQGISSEAVKDGGLLGSLSNALNSARGGEGSGGAENPLESLLGDARDFIDNNFQGDQISREEINDRQNEAQAERQEFIDSNPALNFLDDTVGEVNRIGLGGVLGAAESVLGSAEVLGDTIKSIPSLVGLAEADGKNTPWSNQYEWAQWNLGSDEYGAQTKVGKVAQGFAEFGILMAGTGGFRAVQGVGQAWKAASGLGKAKVLATTAAKEGMYGMAADFIDGTAGSDNLTTLIRDNFPDLLPDWMEALATEDSDGPLTNGLKNTLEGFGLGSLVGAIGAPIAGMAAVRRLPANAPVEVKREAFVEGAQRSLAETSTIDVPPGAKAVFNRLQDIDDQTHFQRYRTVMDQYEKGIPVTYDDIAYVFPDYFTPGPRQLPNDFNGSVYRAIEDLADDDGFTINPFTGARPTEGYSVAIDAAPLANTEPDTVRAFLQKHSSILSREDTFLGAWKDPATGVVDLEISRVVPDEGMAKLLGTAFDQKAIYDNTPGTATPIIPTFGQDMLKNSKNGHLKGPMAAPSPSRAPAESDADGIREVMGVAPKLKEILSRAEPVPGYGKKAKEVIENPTVRVPNISKGHTTLKEGLSDAFNKATRKVMGGDPKAPNKKWFEQNMKWLKTDLSAEYNMSQKEFAKLAYDRSQEMLGQLSETGAIDFKFVRQDEAEVISNLDAVALSGLMKLAAKDIHKKVRAVGDLGKEGMDNSMHAISMIESLRTWGRLYKDASSLDAVRLQRLQIDVTGKIYTYSGMDPKKIETLFDSGDKKLDELLEALADGSPKARLKAQKMAAQLALADGNPAKMRGIWESFWKEGENIAFRSFYNSLLSNTETHIVNGLSSATNAWLRPLAASLGTGDFRNMRAAQWNFKQNLGEAWDQAMTAWKTGEGVSDTTKKMQHKVGSEETQQALAVLRETANQTGDKRLGMGLNFLEFMHGILDSPLLSLPTKVMTTTDEFMKAWTARIEFQNRTFDDALRAGDDSAFAFDDTFQALLDKQRPDTFSETGEILDPKVLATAQEGNFQQGLKGMAASFGNAINDNPYLRVFFPFVKTGHNLTVFGMQHTPILARRLTEWKDVMEGSDEFAKAVLKGRERIGFGLVGAAGMAYMTGNITGAPDPDATQREIQNRPPYSIKIAGKWVDYSRITPFDFPLRFVATVGDAVQKSQLSEDQAGYLMSYLGWTLSTNLTQRSVTAGLKPLGQLLSPNGVSAESIQAQLANIANGFLPGSSARRQVNNIFRPHRREFEDQMDKFMDTFTFGYAGESAIHYDFLDGTPVKNLNAGMNASINPMNVHERGTSPGRDWLEDIQYDKNLVFKTEGGIKLKPAHRSAIAKKMGKGGLGKDLDILVQQPYMIESREKYMRDLRDPNTDTEGIKEQYVFWSATHDLILEHKERAKLELQSDPAFAEHYAEINDLKYRKKAKHYEETGAVTNLTSTNPFGI